MKSAAPPEPRRISAVLRDLNKAARHMLDLPAAAFGWRDRLLTLREEVAAAIARPAVDVRAIDDTAAMLVTAMTHLARSSDRADRWLKVIACLRECVREDYVAALELELVEMTDHS